MKNIASKIALVSVLALAAVVVIAPNVTHAANYYPGDYNSYANYRSESYIPHTVTGEVYDVYANGGGIYNTSWIVPALGRGYGYPNADISNINNYNSTYGLGSIYGNTYGYGQNAYGYGLGSNYYSPSYYNSYGSSAYNSYGLNSGYGSYNSGYGNYGYYTPSYY